VGRKTAPVDMTFQETVLTSKESDAPIVFDPQTLNPHFDYQEDDGSIHHVWFLDAITAHNQMRRRMRYVHWHIKW
jgi:peptidoglycan-N-acetylglucosamine deacetylase